MNQAAMAMASWLLYCGILGLRSWQFVRGSLLIVAPGFILGAGLQVLIHDLPEC